MSETSFDSSRIPALQWGITNEPIACTEYIERSMKDFIFNLQDYLSVRLHLILELHQMVL